VLVVGARGRKGKSTGEFPPFFSLSPSPFFPLPYGQTIGGGESQTAAPFSPPFPSPLKNADRNRFWGDRGIPPFFFFFPFSFFLTGRRAMEFNTGSLAKALLLPPSPPFFPFLFCSRNTGGREWLGGRHPFPFFPFFCPRRRRHRGPWRLLFFLAGPSNVSTELQTIFFSLFFFPLLSPPSPRRSCKRLARKRRPGPDDILFFFFSPFFSPPSLSAVGARPRPWNNNGGVGGPFFFFFPSPPFPWSVEAFRRKEGSKKPSKNKFFPPLSLFSTPRAKRVGDKKD